MVYTKVCNHQQPFTTTQNHPQPSKIILNYPQPPQKTTHNHPQPLPKKAKTYHKQLCSCTLDVNTDTDV